MKKAFLKVFPIFGMQCDEVAGRIKSKYTYKQDALTNKDGTTYDNLYSLMMWMMMDDKDGWMEVVEMVMGEEKIIP